MGSNDGGIQTCQAQSAVAKVTVAYCSCKKSLMLCDELLDQSRCIYKVFIMWDMVFMRLIQFSAVQFSTVASYHTESIPIADTFSLIYSISFFFVA